MNKHQAFKLASIASDLGHDSVPEKKWWKNRNNFIDLEIDYDIDQSYKDN